MRTSLRARRMQRHFGRMHKSSKLNLTALMDIFTILVFFLMVNSGDVEVLQADKDIKLPESSAEQTPDVTLLVKISATDLIVGGRAVAQVDAILAQDADVIDALATELNYLAERKPITDAQREKGRPVTIMGDKDVPYKLLKRVMTTCAQADYRDISLAVSKLPAAEPDSESLPQLQQELSAALPMEGR